MKTFLFSLSSVVLLLLFYSCADVDRDKKQLEKFIRAVDSDMPLENVLEQFMCKDLEDEEIRSVIMEGLGLLRQDFDSIGSNRIEVWAYKDLEHAEKTIPGMSEDRNVYVLKHQDNILFHILMENKRILSLTLLTKGSSRMFLPYCVPQEEKRRKK